MQTHLISSKIMSTNQQKLLSLFSGVIFFFDTHWFFIFLSYISSVEWSACVVIRFFKFLTCKVWKHPFEIHKIIVKIIITIAPNYPLSFNCVFLLHLFSTASFIFLSSFLRKRSHQKVFFWETMISEQHNKLHLSLFKSSI